MAGDTPSVASVKTLVKPYDMQWWLEVKVGDEWTAVERVTEVNSAEQSKEVDEYKAKYLDRKVQPVYAMSAENSVEFELDAAGPAGVQASLAAVEDEFNVPGRVTRTLAWDFKSGTMCAQTALTAKRAMCTVNVQPIKQGGTGDPLRITAKCSLTEEWQKGTFDATAKTFTAASASA